MSAELENAENTEGSNPSRDQMMLSSIVVKLDVGGKIFKTKLSTICRSPLLYGIYSDSRLSRQQNCEEDVDCYIFIDRNSNSFENVLDFLRNGDLFKLPPDVEKVQMLLMDAHYYVLPQLNRMCETFLQDLRGNCVHCGKNLLKSEARMDVCPSNKTHRHPMVYCGLGVGLLWGCCGRILHSECMFRGLHVF